MNLNDKNNPISSEYWTARIESPEVGTRHYVHQLTTYYFGIVCNNEKQNLPQTLDLFHIKILDLMSVQISGSPRRSTFTYSNNRAESSTWVLRYNKRHGVRQELPLIEGTSSQSPWDLSSVNMASWSQPIRGQYLEDSDQWERRDHRSQVWPI